MNAPRRKLFLSYRRDDSSGYTQLLYDKLAAHYGQSAVFRDVHAIHPAEQFREVIATALEECAVVLVVISRHWGTMADASGQRRLAAPDDILCLEVATALGLQEAGVKVVPVLVGRATMPKLEELPEKIHALRSIQVHEISDQRWEYDSEALFQFIDGVAPVAEPMAEFNPFIKRGAIHDDAFFHDRENERRMLRDYIRGRQNCQIVGPRRIGKSSLLAYVKRHCPEWSPSARVAYLDLHDPRCATLKGWLRVLSRGLGLTNVPTTLADLMDELEELLAKDIHPVVCLDEFGEMAKHLTEFPREVYLTLRSCGQRGMSILTAAPKKLSELTDPRDVSSPFFNTFPILTLGPFEQEQSRAFVDLARPGVPAFTESEKRRILEFARGQPFNLQAACFHVLATRESHDDIGEALDRARVDFEATQF